MLFLIQSRASSAAMTAPDDSDLDERHWTYWERYADALIARGPTLNVGRSAWTGSIHVVDLAGLDAAWDLVEHEPYHLAGAYSKHIIWRFENLLGRTMWSFARSDGEQRFFLLPHQPTHVEPLPLAELPSQLRDELVVYGALIDPVRDEPAGVAAAVQAPDEAAATALAASVSNGQQTEVHGWDFGGRR